MLPDEAERMANLIINRSIRLTLAANQDYHPDYCPLRKEHYALSGLVCGFPSDGWDCPFCGRTFIPRCANCAGDDW